MFDVFPSVQQLKCITVVDEYAHESLVSDRLQARIAQPESSTFWQSLLVCMAHRATLLPLFRSFFRKYEAVFIT